MARSSAPCVAVVADAACLATVREHVSAQRGALTTTLSIGDVADAPTELDATYVLFASEADAWAPDAVEALVAALEADATADVALASCVLEDVTGELTVVPARPSVDPLFDWLAGPIFVPPLGAVLFRVDLARRLVAAKAHVERAPAWRCRELVTTALSFGATLRAAPLALTRAPAPLPTPPRDRRDDAARVFSRMRGQSIVAKIEPRHRELFDQSWSLHRHSGRTITSGPRTRAFGAVATVAGHVLSGLRESDTIEGLVNRVRITVPRLVRSVSSLRGAIKSLVDDGLLTESEA